MRMIKNYLLRWTCLMLSLLLTKMTVMYTFHKNYSVTVFIFFSWSFYHLYFKFKENGYLFVISLLLFFFLLYVYYSDAVFWHLSTQWLIQIKKIFFKKILLYGHCINISKLNANSVIKAWNPSLSQACFLPEKWGSPTKFYILASLFLMMQSICLIPLKESIIFAVKHIPSKHLPYKVSDSL